MRKKILSILFFATVAAAAQPAVYKIDKLVERISNPDTLFVVNLWATWCKPCIRELPSFDSLQARHPAGNLKVLLVSLDFREDLQKKVVPFLNKHKVRAECILLDESNGNDFINRICGDWSGAIPATLVRQGNKTIFAEKSLVLAELENIAEDVRKQK